MTGWHPSEIDLLLADTAITFAAGLLFALIVRWARQSPLIGYLIAGLVIGPYGFSLITDREHIAFFAELGVVLLMFALGVQLSIRQLLEARVVAIVGGLGQIVISILLGLEIGFLFGFPVYASLVLGYALALSSSVVLVRLLGDLGEYHTVFGRVSLGISIMQDLMAVVIISTLPFLTRESTTSYAALSVNLLKAVLFVLWVILLARWVAPYILKWASTTGSREVLLPTVIVLSLGSALLSGVFGFSYALGAFLAGIVISESIFSQAVLSEVIPLRDIFGLLFFVSLGMLVNPAVVFSSGWLMLVLLLAAVVGKTLIIFTLVVLLRHHPYVALLAGVGLSQIGEFSFIISREAQVSGIISASLYSTILSVAIISIALTPILLPAARWAYQLYSRRGRPAAAPAPEAPVLEELTTVLLCGYGRVGRTIGQALDTFRIPFMVIDMDRRTVEALRRRGIRAIYGDASNLRLLERIGAGRYQLGVITVPERSAVHTIALHLRRLSPHIRLLLRSHNDTETALYLSMGVVDVVQVELEASLAFVQKVLTTADVDGEIVAAYLDDIRIGYYEGLYPRGREE